MSGTSIEELARVVEFLLRFPLWDDDGEDMAAGWTGANEGN